MGDPKVTKRVTRQLRDRKERKLYAEDWVLGDEEIEGRRSFRLEDKIDTDRFQQHFVREMQGADFTLAHVQRHGFTTPVLFRDKAGLGLRVPSTNFTVTDVRMCVGSRRPLDVMDVNTQKNVEMTMKEWERYYLDPDKDRLLNVISLEFSHTKLENYVQTPSIVRQMDWVDCVWPRHLKELQTESTNAIDDMMYPKVQKYCLMSVKGCYTDFHIDFGGTSVWYHILKGGKIFWLIQPTEHNVALYQQWVLSGKQADIFFGDTVDKCARITLTAGNTFFIPTGWIHAVYTPMDSLVFGGNFLHSFGIEKQLKVAQVEDTTHVPQKFRYPFFTEMLWYVLERYVHCLLGRSHLSSAAEVAPEDPEKAAAKPHVHLTPQELHGLKAIVMFLHSLPTNKKNVPELLTNPIALIKDVRSLVEQHRYDNSDEAITGAAVLRGGEELGAAGAAGRVPLARNSGNNRAAPPAQQQPAHKHKVAKEKGPAVKGGPRRRRTRCKKCEACQRSDCGECSFCQDMVKFGGPGRAKQTCIMRQCLQPMLPVTAACAACKLDGWGQAPVIPIQKMNREMPSSLMECSVCYEIIHPECVAKMCPGLEGVVNEDLPNSWECPKCCQAGKNVEYRPRHFRARHKSTDIRRMSVSSDTSSVVDCKEGIKTEALEVDSDCDDFGRPLTPESPPKRVKMEPASERSSWSPHNSPTPAPTPTPTPTPPSASPIKHCQSSEDVSTPAPPLTAPLQPNAAAAATAEPRKLALRTQLAHQLSGNSSKALKKPTYVVRPTPAPKPAAPLKDAKVSANALEKSCILPVLRLLTPVEISRCAAVCKTWYNYSIDPSLWRRMDLSHVRLTAAHLSGMARRQPEALVLDWTGVAKRQLFWLIGRLSQLRELSLQGCTAAGVAALRTCVCPPLNSLDLSFVSGLNDAALRDILSPPPDSRPGLVDTKSRLRNLRTLKLAGCDLTDISLRYITQHLPRLAVLDISSCNRITDAGVAQITTAPASTIDSLQTLDLSNCRLLTDASLDHLARCDAISRLDLRHTPNITAAAIAKFAVRSKHELRVMDGKLIGKRNPV